MYWPFGFNASSQSQYPNSTHSLLQTLLLNDIVSPLFPNMNFSPPFLNIFSNLNSSTNSPELRFNHKDYRLQISEGRQNLTEKIPSDQNFVLHEQNSASNQQISNKSSSSNNDSIRLVRFRRRRKVKRQKNQISHNSSLRNDTKNIPKNYGKALLTYIQKNTRQLRSVLEEHETDFMEFMMAVKECKKKISTIHDLRQMWGEKAKQDRIKKCIRIISYNFMRKKCLSYIFNSRIKNYRVHIKYRKTIMEGIANPDKFTKIKEF